MGMLGQAIASTQFYVLGKRQFTRTGYVKNVKKYLTPFQIKPDIKRGEAGADGVDLEGKVIVITGANSGIGKELATYAATKGARVYMLCRSKERAEKAREEIIKISDSSEDLVKVLLADVGELSQVRKVVTELQAMETKIDCLVCNAGVLLNERRETSEGREVTFASHLLGGSYLLPTLLMPQLKEANKESNVKDQARVVFVSSGGMYNTKFPKWDVASSTGDDQKGKYDGNMAYSYAKRGQVLLAERWTRQTPEICFVSAHPGWTGTDAVDLAYGSSKKYLEPMRTPWEGAEGISWCMSTERTNLESGQFYLDRSTQTKHVAGAFMGEGSFTKNTEAEVDEMMEHLEKECSL